MAGKDNSVNPNFLFTSDDNDVSNFNVFLFDFWQLSVSSHFEQLVLVLSLVFVDVEILNIDKGFEKYHDNKEKNGNYFLSYTETKIFLALVFNASQPVSE